MAWTALAAPHIKLNHTHPIPRTIPLSDNNANTLQDRDAPSPPPVYLPDGELPPNIPPPIIPGGGTRPLLPASQPQAREIQEQDDTAPEAPTVHTPTVPLVLANGGVRTLVPVDDAVARVPQQQTPDPTFIPPPLILPNGGLRPLQPRGRAVEKRLEAIPTLAASVVPKPTFTTVYASPGGPAIPITAQRQLITTYIPTTSCAPDLPAKPSLSHKAAGPSSCTTALSSTVTAICATSLTPLAASPIAITDCEQYVTYSSQLGYTIIPQPTAASVSEGLPRFVEAVQTLTTYYAAPWNGVVPGATPTAGVVEVVCGHEDECQTSTLTPSITATLTPSVTAGVGDNTPGREQPANSITTTVKIYVTETVPVDVIPTAKAP